MDIFQIGCVYVILTILYGMGALMADDFEHELKWAYTIPIWPLTLIVLLLQVIWKGIKVTVSKI